MFYLRTFGGLSIVREESNEEPLAVGAARLAILAVLVATGDRGISRDRLLLLFWPDSTERRARGALKQAVYSLRRLLGVSDLILGTNELRLNPARITADLIEFGRALDAGEPMRAAALYAGPFLDGFYLRDAREFEDWVERERARLAAQFVEAVETMRRSAEENGDSVGVVHATRRLVDADPLSARWAIAYMRALAHAGMREAAIAHAAIHTRLVREQLDQEPHADVAKLLDELKDADAWPLPLDAAPETSISVGEHTPPRAASDGLRPGTAEAARRRSRAPLAMAALVTLVAAATLLAVRGSLLDAPQDELGLIVVAPLENETGDSAYAAVGRLAADWITEVLMHGHVADVVDPRTAWTASDTSAATDAAERLALARRTGARSLVAGAVYANADSLRLQARLVRVEDGRVLVQPVSAVGPASDPAAIVETLAQRLGGALAAAGDGRFVPLAEGFVRPPRYDAYQSFLRGLDLLSRRAYGAAYGWFMDAASLDRCSRRRSSTRCCARPSASGTR